jgi:asparagine synthase (glutamine-hydrolysing)
MEHLGPSNPFTPAEIGARSRDEIPAAVIRLLFDSWLVSNCLSLGDRVSMGVGVESRLPFLDVRLIESVMNMRKKTPDHNLDQKAWLRSALKGILPDEVLQRPKAGFQPPAREWLTGIVTTYGEILYEGELVRNEIIKHDKIDELLDRTFFKDYSKLFFTLSWCCLKAG